MNMTFNYNSLNWILIFCLFNLTLCLVDEQKEHDELSEVLNGLSLDELEMLEDYELKQLRDFVKSKGRGTVSRAQTDEDINLFGGSSNLPQLLPPLKPTKMVTNGSERVDFGAPIQIQPMMIQMPDQLKPISVAQAAPNNNPKKPKLKLRRKNGAEKPKKDEQQVSGSSATNGLREDVDQSNRSEDLTGEDYEKLAKLLQTFVNRRKSTTVEEPTTTQRPSQSQSPTLMPWPLASSHSNPSLPPWAVTPKLTTTSSHAESRKGLSKITEQEEEEEASFVVGDMQKPEPASIWRGHKTTTSSPLNFLRKFDLKERKMEESRAVESDFDSKLSLVDNEVERDPKEWEVKMRQLSRELSTILHKLKTEKEQKGELPKTEYKVAVQSLNPINSNKSQTNNKVDQGSILEVVDEEAGENGIEKEDNEKEDNEKEEQQEDDSPPKSESTQRLTLGALKVNRKNSLTHESSTNGKAYVTILREGIARQTDINEYVFIASITLVRDANKVILVDTGLATDINGRTDLLTKLSKLDIAPPNVNYVITTHGHPDHAGNTNDFPDAVHFQGNMLHYHTKFNFSDLFEKDQHQLTPNIQLIKSPGHTPDDITVLVKNTDKYGTIAICGDVFVAEEDMKFPLMWKPMAWSERTQETSRKRLICESDYIVPGHGKVFRVTEKMRTNFKC